MFHNSLNFNISSSKLAMAGAVASNASHQQYLYQNQHCSKSPPPFLTVVLIKLTKVLPDFCRLLVAAEPPDSSKNNKNNKDKDSASAATNSIAAASQACSVLDSTVATATHNSNHSASPASVSSHGPGSAKFDTSSPSSEPGVWPSAAKPTSPLSLKFWMSPASHAPLSPTTTALALEGEFESFASPFLLLAGAEVLTADLVHLQQLHSSSTKDAPAKSDSDDAASSLAGLYQRIAADLERTEAVLCEPFLRQHQHDTIDHHHHQQDQSNEETTSHSYYADAAAAVAVSLRWLVLVATVRGQLLDVQRAVFVGDRNAQESSSSPSNKLDLAQAAAAVMLLHQAVATATVAAPNLPPLPELPLISIASADDDNDDESGRQGSPDDPGHDAENKKDVNKEDRDAVEPAAMPIVNNLLKELSAWKYCFEACAALERCQ